MMNGNCKVWLCQNSNGNQLKVMIGYVQNKNRLYCEKKLYIYQYLVWGFIYWKLSGQD